MMVRECKWSGWDGGGRWVSNLGQAGGSARGVGDLPRGLTWWWEWEGEETSWTWWRAR